MIDIVDENDPLPSDISAPNQIDPMQAVGEEKEDLAAKDPAAQEKTFANMMQNKPPAPTEMTPKTEAVSPFDLAGLGAKPIATPSTDTLMGQANGIQTSFEDIQGHLSYPNLKLKSSQKYLVKNKLQETNNHLKAANAKLETSPDQEQIQRAKGSTASAGPIAQYLGYVSDGMNQLDAAKKQLSKISTSGNNLAPADFMLLQLKFNKAQQELDFTSALLSKCVEGVKTIMGVQI